MTVTVAVFVEYKFIEAVETVQFTASDKIIIDAVSITNTSAAAVEFSLSIVPKSGAVGSENRAIKDLLLRADETHLCPEVLGQVLVAGDLISAIAASGMSLNIRISGRVIE